MVVAKRQRKGKAPENGTKENPQTRVRTSDETNTHPSWPAQVAYKYSAGSRRGGDKCIKEGSQDGLRLLLWGQPALMPQGCTILCQIKLSCN